MKLLFPGFQTRALTFSYDDGCVQDRRLTALFRKYGLKATFNLNSGVFGAKGEIEHCGFRVDFSKIDASEVASLYRDAEVAMHTVTHPDMTRLSGEAFDREVLEDMAVLSRLSGQQVKGFAYPCGYYDSKTIARLRELGVLYARTIEATHAFSLPEDFLCWRPTCHDHDGRLRELCRSFLQEDGERKLFYVWGHSFELDKDDCDRWAALESFCKEIAGRTDIWYATNLEICTYVNAYRSMKNGTRLPGIPLYVEEGGENRIL